MPNRAVFLVDGFNLYHSLRTAARQLGHSTRWLDLHALCESYLHMVGGGAQLEAVHYFSAVAYHREGSSPGSVQRHEDYIAALRATGVITQLAQFKAKNVRCPKCGCTFVRHEEKETDVAIAAKLLEFTATHACETVVVVSGDTDLIPAIKTSRLLHPRMRVWMAFPAGRANAAFRPVANCFKIKPKQYGQFQLPDPVIVPSGRTIPKPAGW